MSIQGGTNKAGLKKRVRFIDEPEIKEYDTNQEQGQCTPPGFLTNREDCSRSGVRRRRLHNVSTYLELCTASSSMHRDSHCHNLFFDGSELLDLTQFSGDDARSCPKEIYTEEVPYSDVDSDPYSDEALLIEKLMYALNHAEYRPSHDYVFETAVAKNSQCIHTPPPSPEPMVQEGDSFVL